MSLMILGLNHKTAPIEIREKFYFKPIERELLLTMLKNDPQVYEAMIISTCNRTEIYTHTTHQTSQFIKDIILKIKNISVSEFSDDCFFVYTDKDAVRHLCRVACGLDSLILGEKQILGQIKEAIEISRNANMMDKHFNILTNVAIRAGKKARTMTQIDCGGSSISWAAVAMAQREMGTLAGKSFLIIGAGKMGKLASRHIQERGAAAIYVANRTHACAVEIAQEFGGSAVSFWDLREVLTKVDVCICSASAPHYLIEKELVEKVMVERPEQRLICIDISMPRNVNPNVSEVENVSLISIDELDKVLEDTISRRFEAVGEVENIVEQKVEEFYYRLNKKPEDAVIQSESRV